MRILVAYDGSISANAAVDDLPLAGLPQEAEALVVYVADTEELVESQGTATSSKPAEAKSIAADGRNRIKSYFPQWSVCSDALCGPPTKVLIETTDRWHPDLFVIGSHGRSGVRRLFLGSVS